MSMRGGRPQLSFTAEVTDTTLGNCGAMVVQSEKRHNLKAMQLMLVHNDSVKSSYQSDDIPSTFLHNKKRQKYKLIWSQT